MISISSFLNIRPNETRTAVLLTGIMLFSAAGYSLGGTGIEALYFARFGTSALPYLYMGLGFLSLVTSLTITGLLGRIRRERMYVLVPGIASSIVILAWGLLFVQNPIIYPALWLGKEALNTIVSMIAWNTAGAVCDSRQAKRLFPLFNAARILGSVLGGLGTGALVHWIGTQNLVLVWAISMLATYVCERALMNRSQFSEAPKRSSRTRKRNASFIQEMQKGWHYVRRSELMQWVSVASILFSILYFSIALPFSRAATDRYPNENELAAFLGLFNGLSTAAAFLTSLLLANRLFARFGIMTMILVFPLIYVTGFGTLIAFDMFAVVVAFRFVQTLWLSGIADSAWQTMFSAVPAEKRDQVNAFLNGVPEQMGVFLAGTILLVGEQAFSPLQLHIVGFITAIAASIVIWRASSAYRRALVDTLREGRPSLFDQPRGSVYDVTALNVLVEQLTHPDPLMRRLAAENLAGTPRANMLTHCLTDADAGVRLAALQSLTDVPSAAHAILSLLADANPGVRAQTLRTLRALPTGSIGSFAYASQVGKLLQDTSPLVQIEAALSLLKLGPHASARDLLRQTAALGDMEQRKAALQAMAEWGDHEAFSFIESELNDPGAPASIRRVSAMALASCGPQALPALMHGLADEDSSVREGAAQGLASLGESVLPSVLEALGDRSREDGALTTLEFLSTPSVVNELKRYAERRIQSALHYHSLARELAATHDRFALLKESLQARAHQDGLQALRALALTSERSNFQVAIENLRVHDSSQRANALETLETVRESRLIRPLLALWEAADSPAPQSDYAQETIRDLLNDADGWIRACTMFAYQTLPSMQNEIQALVAAEPSLRNLLIQGEPMDTRTTMPVMERVLLLRHVPLLADLTPSDLQRVATLATEHHVEVDEVLFEQGDPGEEMYVIVHGQVRIMVSKDGSEKEFARRGLGEVIGEMSLISGEPRAATVIAAEETHLLCLDRKNFEGLLRERPEVGLAVMRVLCSRLKEATR